MKHIRKKEKSDRESGIVVADDLLGYNRKAIDPFFTTGFHRELEVFHLSQKFSDLPKRTKGSNSNKNILLKHTLVYVENLCRDFAGFDKKHDECENLCREARKN